MTIWSDEFSNQNSVFHIKQVNDEDVKYFEFGINKVFEEKFSIRCKQCKCHIQLPNNGIEVEERRTGKSRTFAISSQASEEDLLEKIIMESLFMNTTRNVRSNAPPYTVKTAVCTNIKMFKDVLELPLFETQ